MSEIDKCRQAFEKKFGVVGTRLPNGNYSSWAHQARWNGFKQAWQICLDGVSQLKVRDDIGLNVPQSIQLKYDGLLDACLRLGAKFNDEARELSLMGDWEKSQVFSYFAREIDLLLKGGGTQNKYDWALIPEHVKFMATDEDGMACGWLVEPHIVGIAWRNQSHLSAHFYLTICRNPYRGDWKDSLEKRPDYLEPVLKDGEK